MVNAPPGHSTRLLVQKANSQSPSQKMRAPLCRWDAPQCVRDSPSASCENQTCHQSQACRWHTIIYGAVPRSHSTDLNQVIGSWWQLERQVGFHAHFTEKETENQREPDASLSREGLDNSQLPSSPLTGGGRAVWAQARGPPEQRSRAEAERPWTQESAEKGPPRRPWHVHLSLSGLRRAPPPQAEPRTLRGGVNPARVCNSQQGTASPKRSSPPIFFLIRRRDLSTVRGPYTPTPSERGECAL